MPLSFGPVVDDDQSTKFKLALGRFIYIFADIERVLFANLVATSGMSSAHAKAVFNDARVDKAKQFIKRLRKASGVGLCPMLEQSFDQLGDITRLRNDIVHYGAVQDGHKFKVSDEMWKLEGARVYYVTAELLELATLDLCG